VGLTVGFAWQVDGAEYSLFEMGALEGPDLSSRMTPLAFLLSSLGLDLPIARMLVSREGGRARGGLNCFFFIRLVLCSSPRRFSNGHWGLSWSTCDDVLVSVALGSGLLLLAARVMFKAVRLCQ
jgi:hypothetical protein